MNLSRRSDSSSDSGLATPLETGLRHAVAVGAVLVLLLPAARGFSDTFGWLPLWLLAMPLSAWWALHRFALPQAFERQDAGPVVRRRRGVQARRRVRPLSRRFARAA